ncbi:hypothetical protein PRIPAC_87061 [Pristionchus pacificus]|uniref:Uncharacterized protein n=1 Tax=Pristionchus pacificus TaxID=54126 RepID=A0A2A6BL01_PRIPA|nr:hypothetical protein PRIPAC_87061 [Pristionchus pacificus]|eukprot:PDM66602.1 hypothetical protein PRIPAC_48019 [Pristionchus pacificus]
MNAVNTIASHAGNSETSAGNAKEIPRSGMPRIGKFSTHMYGRYTKRKGTKLFCINFPNPYFPKKVASTTTFVKHRHRAHKHHRTTPTFFDAAALAACSLRLSAMNSIVFRSRNVRRMPERGVVWGVSAATFSKRRRRYTMPTVAEHDHDEVAEDDHGHRSDHPDANRVEHTLVSTTQIAVDVMCTVLRVFLRPELASPSAVQYFSAQFANTGRRLFISHTLPDRFFNKHTYMYRSMPDAWLRRAAMELRLSRRRLQLETRVVAAADAGAANVRIDAV